MYSKRCFHKIHLLHVLSARKASAKLAFWTNIEMDLPPLDQVPVEIIPYLPFDQLDGEIFQKAHVEGSGNGCSGLQSLPGGGLYTRGGDSADPVSEPAQSLN
jgi:hypothetical protein